MNESPYDTASSILDAAAAGASVPGFETVGRLLVDLGTTTPVAKGEAIRTTAVSAASAATSPGALAGLLALVKPAVLVLGATTLAVTIGLSMRSSSEPSPATNTPPAGAVSSVERNVSDASPSPTTPEPIVAARDETASNPSDTSGAPARPSSPDGSAAQTPPTSLPPSTATPPDGGDPPATSTTSPATTTTAPTTSTPEPPDPNGNNGNDNGKGVGNGNGNNGNGGSGGNGRPGDE